MRLKLTSLGLFLLASTSINAATIISQWTFETAPPADLSNSSSSPTVIADVGNGSASGVHGSGNTDWSTPPGNGSANSFSANTWAVGDYWQFQVRTLGFEDIALSWDQASSGTGPKDFKLQFSTTGTLFSDFGNYVVQENPSSSLNWNSTTYRSGFLIQMDLSLNNELEDLSSVYFRLVNTSTAKANGTLGAASAGGASRIDNFTVNGTAIERVPVSTPDAGSSLLLLSLAFGGITGVLRWRKQPDRDFTCRYSKPSV